MNKSYISRTQNRRYPADGTFRLAELILEVKETYFADEFFESGHLSDIMYYLKPVRK